MNLNTEGMPVDDEAKTNAELDPATAAFQEYLPGLEVGEAREIGLNEFASLMYSIGGQWNSAEDTHEGAIEGDTGNYTYSHKKGGDTVVVTRV